MDTKPEDPDTVCGIGNFRPKWLQKWATARVFLVLHSFIGIYSGMWYAYRIGVLTTVEKKFAFDSKISGTIAMLTEVFPLLFGTIIGYFGGQTHRPRLLAIGTTLMGICQILAAFPYFIHGASLRNPAISINDQASKLDICDHSMGIENCDSETVSPTTTALVFFMLASILTGLGNLPYHSVGISYLDDIAKKGNTPMYFGIMMSTRLMGPLLGFLLASACLKLQEDPFGDDPGYGPDDPRWIGAWWIGYVIQGFLLVAVAIPTALFPRRLAGHLETSNEPAKKKANFVGHLSGMLTAVKRLAKNPMYVMLVLNTITNIYGTFGHHMMLPKYMENQFRLSASDATLLSGTPAIATTMVSCLIGGYFVWKVKPTPKVLVSSMAVLEFVNAVGYLLLLIPECAKIEMANYGSNTEGFLLHGECNALCNCTQKSFTPVCGPDNVTVYFSPCFAGCRENFNKSYSQCSCVSESASFLEDTVVTEGYCSSDGCWSQALVYIIMLPIHQFFANFFKVGLAIMLLRSIEPEDKSVALGTFEALVCSLGFLPFGVIFGALVDSTCLIWEKTCGDTGNCWFYDVDRFSNIIHGTSAGFSALSAITVCVMFVLRGRMKSLYEEDDKSNAEMKSLR